MFRLFLAFQIFQSFASKNTNEFWNFSKHFFANPVTFKGHETKTYLAQKSLNLSLKREIQFQRTL